MEQFRGTISQNGEILEENVEVRLHTEAGRLTECKGYIVTGKGWQTFQPNTKYLLTAEDGRSGEIFFGGHVPFGDGTPRTIEMSFYEGFQ